MHVLGKVLLGFVIVGAIAAVVLTTMALDVRTRWQQQIAQAETDYAVVAKDLVVQRAKHSEEQDALDRVKRGWGDVYQGDANVGNPQTGAVSVGVGQDRGLGANNTLDGTNPIVHAFVLNGDVSEYVGPFELRSAQAGSADLIMKPSPYPGQPIAEGAWRVREEIPQDYHTANLENHTAQIAADTTLKGVEQQLASLNKQLEASKLLLAERMRQLEGDPDVENGNELQKAGFVQAIRDRLTERDQLLAQLHALRLERRLKLEALESLLEQNQERALAYRRQIDANAASNAGAGAERIAADSN
jgi:hypothetical protein